MKYVIVGNSAAAIGAVESIRKSDTEGSITIISNEPWHTYSRPLISYLLLGKTTEEKMKYRDEKFYEENNCELLLSRQVIGINAADKYLILDDNEKMDYDKLLIATGSSPFVPPMTGLDQVKEQYTFSSLSDAKRLEEALRPDARVLIIGAGLIGLKCAEGISRRVGSITVVDLAPKVLSSILDDDASALVKAHLESQGLQFYLGDSVKEFKEDQAVLNGGAVLNFDILVLAVGVRANVSLVKDAGGAVGRGITINSRMETSLPDVYAAGDCTESLDVSSGDVKIMALLPNAYMQGECAGANMAGKEQYFNRAIPMNAIGFFGRHIITAGNYQGETYFVSDGENYKKLFYKDDRLKGYILIGNVAKAGIYTSLIREQTPLDSIDFKLICETPGLMAFSREERQEKLGGGA